MMEQVPPCRSWSPPAPRAQRSAASFALNRLDRLVARAVSGEWSATMDDDQRARLVAQDIESALLRLGKAGKDVARLSD